MSLSIVLLLLFVVLPVLLALAVAALVQRSIGPAPAGELTSNVLRDGEPATATLLDWSAPGQSFLDRRPMVTFRVDVHGAQAAEPFEMHITQSVPRRLLRALAPGTQLDVKLSSGRDAGAIVFPPAD